MSGQKYEKYEPNNVEAHVRRYSAGDHAEQRFDLVGLSSEQYDTVYWALKEYAEKMAKTAANVDKKEGTQDAGPEDFKFLGHYMKEAGAVAFMMEEDNRSREDNRW